MNPRPLLIAILPVAALLASVALVPVTKAAADGGVNNNPGPCNVVNQFSDTDELQDDIFDNFVLQPGVRIKWLNLNEINTWFADIVTTGTITCTATSDSSSTSSI